VNKLSVLLSVAVLACAAVWTSTVARAADLAGNVQGAGKPIAGSTVTLFAAGTGAPAQLAQGKTDDQGAFKLTFADAPADTVLYVIAKGGTPAAAADKKPNDAVALLSVLGTSVPKKVTINELTTVASAFTSARFINGESISGNPLGLRIAAGNAPNLVDPATGKWGKVLLDPLNVTQTTTLAKLNTLGSLISAFATVVRFPADDPSKVETYTAGIAVPGIALDSKGNLWTASDFSLDFPPPKIPDGTPIMLQFKMAVEHLQKTLVDGKTTGVVNLILADGTQPEPKGFEDNINVPWGINIDGNDDVWVAGFWAKNVVLMAGQDTKGHPAGTKAGDVIHVFESGGIQINTDVQIDPAGNVWSANNWNDPAAAIADNPDRATSTWGGGTGITVIYGIAEPVKTPLVGPVQKP